MLRIWIILLLQVLLTAAAFPQKKVVCYFPNWMRDTLPVSKIQFQNLTHIVHGFVWPDRWAELETYSDLNASELVDATHANGKKILISVGGFGQSGNFAAITADPQLRVHFINNLVNFCVQNNYDGIDIDWEFPSDSAEGHGLKRLVSDLRDRLDSVNPDLLLSIAVNASGWWGRWYDFEILKDYVDWFSAMSYNYHGTWLDHAGHNAPLYQPPGESDGSVDASREYLLNTRGIPADQLLLGIPFFGIEFYTPGLYAPSTGGDISYSYREIIDILPNGWTYHWDDLSKVPYLTHFSGIRLITFDGLSSVRAKAEYARSYDMAGVMIWAMGQDLLVTDQQPLLEAAAQVMFAPATPIAAEGDRYPASFQLQQNYPNPFNPNTVIRYQLSVVSAVQLTVYDMLGREVAMLVDQRQPVGSYEVNWNGRDAGGAQAASGLYFYELRGEGFRAVKKMMLVR